MTLECSEKNNLSSFEKLLVGSDVLLKFKGVEAMQVVRKEGKKEWSSVRGKSKLIGEVRGAC